MEVDFSEIKLSERNMWITLIVLILIALTGFLGWHVTPEDRILSWTEWQIFKQQRVYQHELRILTHNADRLAGLLEAYPDPVRGQLVTESVNLDLSTLSQPSLDIQRDALHLAGEAVLHWALGTGDRDTALRLLDQANQEILRAMDAYADT